MRARPTALILALSLVACGGSDPDTLLDEGGRAFNSGRYEEASEAYESALAAISDPAAPEWKRAKMGWILAQTRIDGTRAKEEFLALARSSPGRVDDRDFNQVGSRLGDAGKLEEAIAVLTVGMEAHPDSQHLVGLRDELGKKAEQSGSAGALDALKGLGYVGD